MYLHIWLGFDQHFINLRSFNFTGDPTARHLEGERVQLGDVRRVDRETGQLRLGPVQAPRRKALRLLLDMQAVHLSPVRPLGR
jgi:hypothetical protein